MLRIRCALVFALLAVLLAGAGLAPHAARAQSPPDLKVDMTFHDGTGELRTPLFHVTVTNLSDTVEARDVRVRLTTSLPVVQNDDLSLDTFYLHSPSGKSNDGYVVFDWDPSRSEGVWFPGTIPPGDTRQIYNAYQHFPGTPRRTGYDWFQAELMSSRPGKTPGLEGNNSAREYLRRGSPRGSAGFGGIRLGVRPVRGTGSDEVSGFTVRVARTARTWEYFRPTHLLWKT